MKKKLLSLVLTMCLCLGLMTSLPAYANVQQSRDQASNASNTKVGNTVTSELTTDKMAGNTSEIAENNTDNLLKTSGTFKYAWQVGHDSEATYYYEDAYFKNSSYEYNPHLATMSLCLEMASFGSEDVTDYTLKMKNVESLFGELGFHDFDQNYTEFCGDGITGKPTKDSLGVVAANKKVTFDGQEYTLIALAVRGSGYESEWASNFKIGEEGQHHGFMEARDQAIAFLNDYIKEKGIQGNIKLWMTGFGRAAVTANLVAGAIDGHQVELPDCNLELKDLYTYTFETPAAEVSADANAAVYSNIFNIINPSDLVPKAAPAAWDFKRYGVDQYLPSVESDGIDTYAVKCNDMLYQYQQLEGYTDYDVDNFKMMKIGINLKNISKGKTVVCIVEDDNNIKSQNAFLNDYITLIAKQYAKDRTTYVCKYQDGICDACGVYFGASEEKKAQLLPALKQKLSDNWGSIVWELIRPFGGTKAAYDKIAQYLRESLDQVGMTDYTKETFEASISNFLDLAVQVVLGQPNSATTLVTNVNGIVHAHYPELCFAWMRSMDSNYAPARAWMGFARVAADSSTTGNANFSTGKYRIVRINGLVDVCVYDGNEELVTSISRDVPQVNAEVLTLINDEGEKLIYLPINQDYVVRLAATTEDTVDYAIHEYDPKAGETNHLIQFNDIMVGKDSEVIGFVPAYSAMDIEDTTGKAATSNYTLALNQNLIPASYELSGDRVKNAYYNVSALTQDSSMGLVIGSGLRQVGTYTKVTAMAYDNADFVGWFANGTQFVSSEPEYCFRVDKDVNLIAKFQKQSETKTTAKKDDQKAGKTEITVSTKSEKADITYILNGEWPDGLNAQFEITNHSDAPIKNWTFEFDCDYEIKEFWTADIISHVGTHYVVRGKDYNTILEPGRTLVLGLEGKINSGNTYEGPVKMEMKENQ